MSEPSAARARRKTRVGVVVSDRMNKTVVVRVVRRRAHPAYDKPVVRSTKYYAHDETNEANVGDRVEIMETRPMSRLKRWRLVRVVEKAPVKEAAPAKAPQP
jgi:small subunit ribosomal protein S17